MPSHTLVVFAQSLLFHLFLILAILELVLEVASVHPALGNAYSIGRHINLLPIDLRFDQAAS